MEDGCHGPPAVVRTYRIGGATFTKRGSQSYELVDRCS